MEGISGCTAGLYPCVYPRRDFPKAGFRSALCHQFCFSGGSLDSPNVLGAQMHFRGSLESMEFSMSLLWGDRRKNIMPALSQSLIFEFQQEG